LRIDPESANPLSTIKGGDLCMIGSIYSEEKCPICGGTFKDDGRKALICPIHSKQKAKSFRVAFKGIFRRFSNYDQAYRFLSGLRFKYDEGSFDKRDYRKENPLGFSSLIESWIEVKRSTVKPKSFNNLNNYSNKAIAFFGNRNVKEIGYAELEDFFLSQKISDKTKANMKSALHDFWMWLRKRKIISLNQIPEFPECKFELGFRKTITKQEQEAIVEEVKRISLEINPKIYLGIKWLCTYISVRPGEMIKLKEGDIDLGNGYLFFPHPKEKKPKFVPIIKEDIEIMRTFPLAVPSLSFFRHQKGISGVADNEPFGEKYFYKWWLKACKNLGFTGVDLYGGTRHSSAKALRNEYSPEQIKKATMHSTNKAFERYFQIENNDLREMYESTRNKNTSKESEMKFSQSENNNLLIFKE
jgi:integrase